MSILSILLFILKFIGVILALILAIILIVIFCNIKFRLSIDNEKGTILKVTYLFGIISFIFDKNNDILTLKVFGISIEKFKYIFSFRNRKKSKNKVNSTEQKNEEDSKIIETLDIHKNEQNDENLSENDLSSNSNIDEKNSKEENIEEKTEVINVKAIFEKFKNILNYPDKKLILDSVNKLVRGLIHAIKIDYIKLDLEYGSGDPCDTGCIFGIISAIRPMIPSEHSKYINIVPNFENEIFNINFSLKGKTSIFRLVVPIIKFVMLKPIKNIIFNKGE